MSLIVLQRRLFSWLPGIFLLSMCLCCFANDEHDTKKQAEKTFGSIRIGNGYVTYNQQVMPSSGISDFQVVSSAPEGNMQFELIEDKRSLEKSLGLHASIEVPVKEVQAKNIAGFVKAYENTTKSLSLIYKAEWGWSYMVEPVEQGKSFTLSEDALSRYKESKSTFVSSYGNAFVDQARAGAALYLMVRIHFASGQAKIDFEDKINLGRENILSVMEQLKLMAKKDSLNGSVHVRALQLGGDPAKLSELFLMGSFEHGDSSSHADSGKKSKNDGKGVETASFNFDGEEFGENIIMKAVDYAGSLGQQVKRDDPETLFFFGDMHTTPYSAIDSTIELPQDDSLLNTETRQARREIIDAYRFFQKVQDIRIPFYTYAHYTGHFKPEIKDFMEDAVRLKDNLEDFFDATAVSSQFQCFQAGSEEGVCKNVASELKAILPEDQAAFLNQLHQLDYSVGLTSRYASYPVDFHQQRTDGKTEQQLVSFELNKPNTNSHVVYVETAIDPQSSVYDTVTKDDIRQIYYYEHFCAGAVYSAIWDYALAEKEDTSVFVQKNKNAFNLEPGDRISFHDNFHFPYPSGHICLHLPAGAGFVGSIHNLITDTTKRVPLFGTKKIKASVGDTIELGPVMGKKHVFTVTAPYDSGTAEYGQKLPLHTVVHLKGTTMNSRYVLVYNDQDCY